MWCTENPIQSVEPFEQEKLTVTFEYPLDISLSDYLGKHPATTIYHSVAWLRLIEQSFGHKGYYIIAKRGEHIAGVLPVTLVSSWLFGSYIVSNAFADVGGVCASDPGAAKALVHTAKELGKKRGVDFLELRQAIALPINGFATQSNKVLPVLKLPESEEMLMQGLNKKVRYEIRKALKTGLRVVWGSKELVRPFYEVYARNMRDLGTPMITISFFEKLVEIFGDVVDIIVIYKNGLPIGGAVGLHYRDVFEVPWASSRRDHFDLSPNDLLYWEILKRCVEVGVSYFSFGRSTLNSGPYKFKEKWGPEIVPLHYQFYYPESTTRSELNPANPRYKIMISGWKKLPLLVTNLLGPVIARDLA